MPFMRPNSHTDFGADLLEGLEEAHEVDDAFAGHQSQPVLHLVGGHSRVIHNTCRHGKCFARRDAVSRGGASVVPTAVLHTQPHVGSALPVHAHATVADAGGRVRF